MNYWVIFWIVLLLGVHVLGQEVGAGKEGEGEIPKYKERCQKEFYDITGTVESPEYPNNYPDQTNCVYRIFTNRMVNVRFETFSVEESADCQYDFINVVFDASSGTAPPKRYCGDGLSKVNGGNLRGPGPVIIAFISDEADNMGGFRFTFEIELNGPDPCLSEPCQQEGNCTTYPGYYVCTCPDGYAGANCEIDKDECLSYPCENNGKCIDGVNSFTCECINDFEGDTCEKGSERCASEPCQNGGLCVDRGLDYVCSCPRDFMGDSCETPIPTPSPKETSAKATEKATDNPDDSLMDDNGNGENAKKQETAEPKSGSPVAVIVIVTFLLVLAFLAALAAWYLCTHRKKKEKTTNMTKEETPTREVTLMNMNAKSELD